MAQAKQAPPHKPIALRGAKDVIPSAPVLSSRFVHPRAAFRPDRARTVVEAETVLVKADDVIEIEFEEGQRLWMRGEDYPKQFGGAAARAQAEDQAFLVPDSLDVLPRGMQSRGPVKWTIKSLKVLGVDLENKTAKAIGGLVDRRKSTNRPGLGLYRCSMQSEKFALTPVTAPGMNTDRPYLLFIHGTASSTWGSFGSLWGASRAKELTHLRELYADRVLAYEHATLSESPIANALQLAEELATTLPPNAVLHLVTHSRGGLVGELLCRVGMAGGMAKSAQKRKGNGALASEYLPFTEQELQLFRDKKDYTDSLQQLEKLNEVLKNRHFTIGRFVRVGCPALGTTLASRRLDRWISVVGSVAGAMPDTPLADAFKDMGDFAAAVIKERTDPTSLPGLEGMMPESPLIKLVNWPTTTIAGDLVVIAGDIEPDAWWAKLFVLATDRFYEGDHDLIVNTPSMYGGARRAGRALVSFHKGAGVNHFTYFSNQDSAERLVRALSLSATDSAGFDQLKKPTESIPRAAVLRSAEPRPVVFVLPGIMGSELTSGRQPVWVDIPDLVFGGLRKLNITAKNVQATQPLMQFYGDLLQFLARTHNVIPFPFDWRLPVEVEADRLMEKVRQEFSAANAQNQPIRFLAHSMGGLVVRAMIARHNGLWREITAQQGARFVMLGTPNGGSHAITELLVGQSSLFSKLAFVDIKNSQQELLRIVSRFPGILAMLPVDAAEDYFSPVTWRQYVAAETGLVAPADEDLARAREFRRVLDNSPIDPQKMVYVAGHADVTVTRMYYDVDSDRANEFIKFKATTRGDGRVTWDSGIPPEVPTWYMDVEHGNLPAHEESFPALVDLLQTGTTSKLSKSAPVARAADELFPRPPVIDDFYPSTDGLAASAVGARAGRRKKTKREAPVDVRVVHGNLAFATYPVAVGHYAGDTVISAEADLDRRLDGELTRRARLGLYPGALETCAIFVNPCLSANPEVTPKGAIVVGLGTPGLLSAAEVTKSFLTALLEYALEWSAYAKASQRSDAVKSDPKLGVSALLIGTNAGGISVSDSVYALAKAVARANDTLADANQAERIAHLEFIELWEDRAIQAVKAFEDCEADPSLRGRFTFDAHPHSEEGGLRRVTYEEPAGWWHRVQILGGDDEDPMRRTLRFAATTKRARNEVSLLPTQRILVDRFVEEAIRSTHDNHAVSRTLFELLLPKQLKLQAPDQDDIVLLLDEAAAQYPWELLADPGGPERRPFAIEHGVLRQLETTEFTDSIRPVIGKDALVIGDPVSSFIELKGAQVEAEAVARSLEDGHFRVELRKRVTGDQVMQALYERPYQILHLAGHGVYRYLPRKATECAECGQNLSDGQRSKQARAWQPITGMVIGDNAYLTPVEVQQLPRVPELVFINCCHLGKIEATGDKELNNRKDYNKIASNVATEFIRMGVRAVVAAGWAVDDAAARVFATTFYNHMLAGAPFGKAVKAARQATYDGYSHTNTWGAYQCYGDPDFRIVKGGEEDWNREKEPTFASAADAIAALGNIAARLCTKAGQDQRQERAQLSAAVKVIAKKRWLTDGTVSIALARAYRDTELFDEAIRYYREALAGAPSAVGLADVEQLANLLSRRAVRRYEERVPPVPAKRMRGKARRREPVYDPLVDIDEAIGLLQWLMGTPKWRREVEFAEAAPQSTPQAEVVSGKTVERLCLLGGAYKRRAWVSPHPRTALQRMGRAYKDAYELSVRQGKPNLYPLLNAMAAEMVLEWEPSGQRGRSKKGQERGLLQQCEQLLSELRREEDQLWNQIMQADFRLIDALDKKKLDNNLADMLAAQYAEARKRTNRRKFASALDQVKFLKIMANKLGSKDILPGLDRLSQRLELEKSEGK